MADSELHELVVEIGDRLEATEELAIDRGANRWIGEAQAVAADVADADVSEQVIERRIAQVQRLLENVEGTGNPDADERVAAAIDLAATIECRCSSTE